MNRPRAASCEAAEDPRVAAEMARLAGAASLELSSLEAPEFSVARGLLRTGQRIFVSHLPRQTWGRTLKVCEQVALAGCDPVPHIPIRLLEDERQLGGILRDVRQAGVDEVLLISGDYRQPLGAFADVMSVLQTGQLQEHGFTRVSLAGHPEGHPAVAPNLIRRAQIEKARHGAATGLKVSLVTQFFFDAAPFVEWATDLRRAGVDARLVAGLAGPASITKLLSLARRCGVGPSLRALAARPTSLVKLVTDQDPGGLLRALARAATCSAGMIDGIHLFSFGGFERTARWLHEAAKGDTPAPMGRQQ